MVRASPAGLGGHERLRSSEEAGRRPSKVKVATYGRTLISLGATKRLVVKAVQSIIDESINVVAKVVDLDVVLVEEVVEIGRAHV